MYILIGPIWINFFYIQTNIILNIIDWNYCYLLLIKQPILKYFPKVQEKKCLLEKWYWQMNWAENYSFFQTISKELIRVSNFILFNSKLKVINYGIHDYIG